jgi:hypothetical protein
MMARRTETQKDTAASTAKFWGEIIKGTAQVSEGILRFLYPPNVEKAGNLPCLLTLTD